jgi:hypothetical protein
LRSIRAIPTLAAALALAPVGVALAAGSAATPVTGGSTDLTLSASASSALQSEGIAASALAPARISGATVAFPISGGALNIAGPSGTIDNRGALKLTRRRAHLVLRAPVVHAQRGQATIWASTVTHSHRSCRGHGRHRRCTVRYRFGYVKIANVSGVALSATGASGTVTLSAAGAKLLNRLAHKKFVTAGTPLGTATVAPTFG